MPNELPATSSKSDSVAMTTQQQKRAQKKVTKNADGHYVCECGYNAKERKNRLTNHQDKHCNMFKKTVRTDIQCPVCDKEFSYDGLKAHILSFTKVDRKHQTYVKAHANRSVDQHKLDLDYINEKYGPKN